MTLSLPPWFFRWCCAISLLLSACQPDHPAREAAYPHKAAAGPNKSGLPVAAAMQAIIAQVEQQLGTVALSGNVDTDFVALLLVQDLATLQLADLELAQGRDSVLRTLADTLHQERQRESLALLAINDRLRTKPTYGDGTYNEELRECLRTVRDSAARRPAYSLVNVDKTFAIYLAAHLQTGVLLASEEVAHGDDPLLVSLAHRMVRDQRRHLRQTRAWAAPPPAPHAP
jgi:uncharacterized protein (DUF305 family)